MKPDLVHPQQDTRTSPKERVALITGASSGLGAALASYLAQEGYGLGLHFNKRGEVIERLAQSLDAAQVPNVMAQADLSREAAARELVGHVTQRLGRLDALINCTGAYDETPLLEASEAEWFAGLNSTATAAFFATRESLPWLRKSGRGRVVNIGDSSCDRPTARDVAIGYHLGKTGVLMLTRSFAELEAAHGITVNMVSPGFLENSVGKPPVSTIPAGRFGRFEDIWHTVRFLLSDQAGYLTGSNLVLSGGWNLR